MGNIAIRPLPPFFAYASLTGPGGDPSDNDLKERRMFIDQLVKKGGGLNERTFLF